jgi:hypothetical protein
MRGDVLGDGRACLKRLPSTGLRDETRQHGWSAEPSTVRSHL